MDLERFCSSSRVLIVAGKGGVGKTTVTASLAVLASRLGLDVLVVEVEGKSGLSAMFDRPALTYAPAELAERVTARTLTPDDALLDYLDSHGMRRVSKRLVRSGAAEIISTAAPGIKDILVLGKIKSIEKHQSYDLVLVDAPAAGHAVTFLTSPRGLLDAVRVGPIRQQAREVMGLLSDSRRCRTMLVTLAEETPVNEVVETAFALEDRVGVSLTPIVLNELHPQLGGAPGPSRVHDVRDVLEAAERAGVFVSEREAADLAAAASFRHARRALQQRQVSRLRERLPLSQLHLPFVARTDFGPPELELLADALAEQVEGLQEAA